MAAAKSLSGQLKTKGRIPAVLGCLVIVLIVAAMTLLKITQTYGDFWREAFHAPGWLALLALLNLAVAAVVIAWVVFLIKPRSWFAYAVVVVASVALVLAGPIAVSALTGDDVPGQPDSVKSANLYNPIDKLVSDRIDQAVRHRRHLESNALVNRYVHDDGAGKRRLVARLDKGLAAQSLSSAKRAKLKRDVSAILADRSLPYKQRLREIATSLFSQSQRDLVKRLARK